MFEFIRDALIWITSWVLDRRPHSGEAFRLLFLIAFSVLATWLAFHWRTFVCRYATVRRRLMPDERYAGRYLQALWRQGEIRYSFVNIFYNWRRRRFEVAGRTYNPAGEVLATFQSANVRFPSGKDANIEFVWRTRDNATGFTRMTLEDSDEDYIQGHGSVITFDGWPKSYPVRFKHLHDQHVRGALGVGSPASSADEPDFIRKFHARYGEHVMEGFGGAGKGQAPGATRARYAKLISRGARRHRSLRARIGEGGGDLPERRFDLPDDAFLPDLVFGFP